MSKRKFGFEGFGLNKQSTYNFDRPQQPQRLYVPPSSRTSGGSHDHYEDTDLDNIDYDDSNATDAADGGATGGGDEEVDPLDAFMEGIHEEMRAAPPPKAKEKVEKYMDDEEDDPMESFLRAKKDLGLTLASDALNAGYDSDEEVYAAAKAVDAGIVEYDSDDNPIVVDRRKIEPIPALDHSSIDYEPFNKDFYEEKPSISGTLITVYHHILYKVLFFFSPSWMNLLVITETVSNSSNDKMNTIFLCPIVLLLLSIVSSLKMSSY